MLNWINQVSVDLAVLVGCDLHLEWMLPWWHEHYSNHNKLPLYFADFGMSQVAKDWCLARGSVLDLVANSNRKSWFKKPLAILKTPAIKIIWTDIDCEIRGDLSPLFDYATPLGLTLDPHNKIAKRVGGPVVATGVVAVEHGCPIVCKWAKSCMKSPLRGDQEVLNNILGEYPVNIMPPEYQWLRLDGNNTGALIMHWTGPVGKNTIRRLSKINGCKHTQSEFVHPRPTRKLKIKSVNNVLGVRAKSTYKAKLLGSDKSKSVKPIKVVNGRVRIKRIKP
jgi:hypothetical protein